MANSINPLVIGGAAVGLYLLLKPSSPAIPASASAPASGGSLLSSLLPGSAAPAVPTTYGINSGVRGGNGSFYTCSNYAQLLAANPNLGNPSYQMSAGENTQYLANYSDLQQGLPSWIGVRQPDGSTPQNINQAAQAHWKYFGCAEKRIFLPLQPPSTAAYIPPPANVKAASSGGGGSFWSSALQVAGAVAETAILAGTPADPYQLTDAEVNIIVTGSAIAKNILPFYLQVAPELVASINNKMDVLLSAYQN
jgi:hypothetical protein